MTTETKQAEFSKIITESGIKRIVTVDVGSFIETASGRIEQLMPCKWDRAMFRFPNYIQEWREQHAHALNVKIVGRTFQEKHGAYRVKVQLEWINDDEPSDFTEGWLIISPWDCPKVEQVT